jgi:putative ABC transport system permease protein
MKLADHLEFAFSSLWKTRLRTSLTTLGVSVGIGALVSMMSFGMGMQKNLTDSFNSMELFNSITVLSEGRSRDRADPDEAAIPPPAARRAAVPLDEKAVAEIAKLAGVELVFPDIRFPALIRVDGREDLRLVQALPAKITSSKLLRLAAGKAFQSDQEDAILISNRLLRQFKITDPAAALGKKIEIGSIGLDSLPSNPLAWMSVLSGAGVKMETYSFTLIGVTEGMGIDAPTPFQSDVYIPSGSADRVHKLPFSSIWDLFRAKDGKLGYSALNVRVSSPKYIAAVQSRIREMGFTPLALADQFEQIRKTFYYMDMALAAVGMIAIFVAGLGIINTMVMSILERYAEIGIMKAVGARDGDIKKIFFFESSSIGFLGGIGGLALGWAVSRIINQVVNYFLARQGVPYIEFFNLTVWLCFAAVAFSLGVSLVAGIYPALRAARVDPVVALRHD